VIDYLRDPAAIYRRSFELIRAEADLSAMPPDAGEIATRVIHACGMPEIVPDLRISPDFVAAAKAALAAGADGLFIETHPDPANAISDGPNMIPLDELPRLLAQCLAVWKTVRA